MADEDDDYDVLFNALDTEMYLISGGGSTTEITPETIRQASLRIAPLFESRLNPVPPTNSTTTLHNSNQTQLPNEYNINIEQKLGEIEILREQLNKEKKLNMELSNRIVSYNSAYCKINRMKDIKQQLESSKIKSNSLQNHIQLLQKELMDTESILKPYQMQLK